MRRLTTLIATVLSLILFLAGCGGKPAASPSTGGASKGSPAQVTLKVATHWGEGFQDKLLPYLDEYTRLNPHVTFSYESVPFEEYLKKVQVSHTSGDAPDIYHIYSLWGVQLSRSRVIAEAPANIATMLKNEYTSAAVGGVTIDGKFWGLPTELNNYMLLYNKKLLKEAGYDAPPKTWDEAYQIAKAITKKRDDGSFERVGMAFMKGWDSAVVHPWMTLLYTQGGKFMADDLSKVAFNSPEGIAALEFQLRMFQEGISDPNLNNFSTFPNGQLGMIVFAPFWEDGLKDAMGEDFKDIGVAPVPVGKSGKPASVSYSWFWAVSNISKNKEEAWKFLQWLNGAQREGGKGTRMGQYLVSVGILPGRKDDLEAFPEQLQDAFTKPFIDGLAYTVAEPNIPQGQEIKTILMREIEQAWFGEKTAAEALAAAEAQINKILQEEQ